MYKEERWILISSQISGKQQGRIYWKPHLSDHTCCPGKAAPALKSFPLILSLLFQVLQDFLHLAHTCYFWTGTLHQISPQIKTLQVATIYEHHDIHIPIFSGCYWRYHYISHHPTSLVSVSFTLLPLSPKLLFLLTTSNCLSITFLLPMNPPVFLLFTLALLHLAILQLIFNLYKLQRYSALRYWLDETLLSLPRNKEGNVWQFLAPGTEQANEWWKWCSAFQFVDSVDPHVSLGTYSATICHPSWDHLFKPSTTMLSPCRELMITALQYCHWLPPWWLKQKLQNVLDRLN